MTDEIKMPWKNIAVN